jgi:DNA-binding response OmpR family regulator
VKALVVDDDLALADVVAFTLRRAGYEVIVAHDGLVALDRWQTENPDLVILDLNMPKLDGLKVCKRIRAQSKTPIIMLTVRGDENDIIEGLKTGADDYIIKPFSPRQLVARAEAVLRRSGKYIGTPGQVKAGTITLDPLRCEIHLDDQNTVRLTRLECRLLETLMIHRGQVLPTDTLIDHIWGIDGGDPAMLKQLVYRLRRKLNEEAGNSLLLETIPGIGYCLSK